MSVKRERVEDETQEATELERLRSKHATELERLLARHELEMQRLVAPEHTDDPFCDLFRKAKEFQEASKIRDVVKAFLRKLLLGKNVLATDLIWNAIWWPNEFTKVKNYKKELYTALTNVGWVRDDDKTASGKTASFMTMRTASRLVEFISSIVGEMHSLDLDFGPYGVAKTGEGIKLEDENAMHRLIREQGFSKLELEVNETFLKNLQATYTCSTNDVDPDDILSWQDSHCLEKMLRAWAGDVKDSVQMPVM